LSTLKPLFKSPLLMVLSLSSAIVVADIQPKNASLNYSQKSLSTAGNPAAAALIVERKDPHVMSGGLIELGAGIEYGDVDELFAKIDELASEFNPPDDGGSNPGEPTSPSEPSSWDDLFNTYPELEGRVDLIKTRVATTAALLGLIASEGYAKAEAKAEASFVLNEDLYGGTLLFGTSYVGNAKTVGIFEDLNFDVDQARAQLETLSNFDETDPIQALDLSGGITLFYNPANNQFKLAVTNDSLLLIKATKITQMSLSYSRKWQTFADGDLYWGVKPTFYRVGLTNVSARVGEISDSEALFDDIKNADYIYQNGFDLDLGLVWATPNYQLGASLTNVIEKIYKFPELDRSKLQSSGVLQALDFNEEFTMQRQLKLEGGIYTEQRRWSLNVELDANSVEDPMRDEYQWLTVTGGYAADSWWLPSARVGFSRNLAGTQLSYLNAGVTVMKFINIDVAATLDTVTLDGSEIRRGFNIRAGVQFAY